MYLGHIVDGGQLRPEQSKLGDVAEFPIPSNKKDYFWALQDTIEMHSYLRITLRLTYRSHSKTALNKEVWTNFAFK